jgi:hypothetical protein
LGRLADETMDDPKCKIYSANTIIALYSLYDFRVLCLTNNKRQVDCGPQSEKDV